MSEKRCALVVASYQYDDPGLSQLVAPSHDAEALARVLKDPDIGGFDVQVLVNEPSYKVRLAIETFFDDRGRDDLLLLFFSGHGVKDQVGRLYFATPDTRRGRLRSTAVPAADVNDVMQYSRSRRQVLVLDCCFSGAFTKGFKAENAVGSAVGAGDQLGGRGRVVLTASDAFQYAFEGDAVKGEGVQSVFTEALVRGLETGQADLKEDGTITLDELYDYVYDRVRSKTPQQIPQKWEMGVQGNLVLAKNPFFVKKAAELPPEIRSAVEHPLASVRWVVIEDLKQLLDGADRDLALAAREALEKLAGDDSRQVSAEAASVLEGEVTISTEVKAPEVSPPDEVTKPEPHKPPVQEKVRPDTLTITTPFHMELVHIPAGEFLMGSDPSKDNDALNEEQPQHTIRLSEYSIGKFQVTNDQFAVFKGDKRFPNGQERHPVVDVSWYDAVAFCEWLSEETGRPFRLPTEAEWEKAARGTDGRIYPWGDKFDKSRCNTKESGKVTTTPVDFYGEKGASLFGCIDMIGNVWELCSSLYKPLPYKPDDGREDPTSTQRRVQRGGSFLNGSSYARCASRALNIQLYPWGICGFRVVCGVSPISLPSS